MGGPSASVAIPEIVHDDLQTNVVVNDHGLDVADAMILDDSE